MTNSVARLAGSYSIILFIMRLHRVALYSRTFVERGSAPLLVRALFRSCSKRQEGFPKNARNLQVLSRQVNVQRTPSCKYEKEMERNAQRPRQSRVPK